MSRIEIPTDLRALKDCDWPGCPAVYDFIGGPVAKGWVASRGRFWTGIRACPEHSPHLPDHRPSAENVEGGVVVTCTCGEVSPVLPAMYFVARGWWQQHVLPVGRDS